MISKKKVTALALAGLFVTPVLADTTIYKNNIQGSSSKTPVAKPDGTKMFCSAFLNDARMCCFFANTIVKY